MRCLFMMVAALALTGSLTNCKKEEAEPDTKTMLLSSKWHLTGLWLEAPTGSQRLDMTIATYRSCELDDIIEFQESGKFWVEEGASTCVPSNNSTFYNMRGGEWSLINNDSGLSIKAGFSVLNYTFAVKRNSWMELTKTQKDYLDQEIKYIYVFEAVK